MESIIGDFPFRTALSFDPLFSYLRKRVENIDKTVNFNEKRIQSLLKKSQDLRGLILDPRRLKAGDERVNRLMSTVFSPLSWETEAVGAVIPFSIEPFFVSPQFKRLFIDANGALKGRINVGTGQFDQGRIIQAYLFILEKFYGIRQRFDYPVIRIVNDPDTGLERHYKMELDFRFAEIHAVKAPKALSEKERDRILEHLTELKYSGKSCHPKTSNCVALRSFVPWM